MGSLINYTKSFNKSSEVDSETDPEESLEELKHKTSSIEHNEPEIQKTSNKIADAILHPKLAVRFHKIKTKNNLHSLRSKLDNLRYKIENSFNE